MIALEETNAEAETAVPFILRQLFDSVLVGVDVDDGGGGQEIAGADIIDDGQPMVENHLREMVALLVTLIVDGDVVAVQDNQRGHDREVK